MVWRQTYGSFEVDVNWPLGDNDNWIDASSDLRNQTGIMRYRVCRNEGNWVYDYYVEIENDRDLYHYTFVDAEPDTYGLKVENKGTHHVKYNSKDPRICKIRGYDERPMSDYAP